jgi:hypothetical protein
MSTPSKASGSAAVLNIRRIKSEGQLRAAVLHNHRAWIEAPAAMPHINSSKSAHNVLLSAAQDPRDVHSLRQARMATMTDTQRKLRKDAVLTVEFIVSLPNGLDFEYVTFFNAAQNWLGQRFGGLENITSAVVHFDEPMPHMHVLIVPVIQGRLCGSDAIGYGRKFTSLLREFHVEVAAAFGLRAHAAAPKGQARKTLAKAVLQELTAKGDAVFASALFSMVKEAIEAQPAKYAALLNVDWDEAPARRGRTMTEIFTSTGRGSQRA